MTRFAVRQHDSLRTATGRRHHLNLLLHDYDLVLCCMTLLEPVYSSSPANDACRKTTRPTAVELQAFCLAPSFVTIPLALRRGLSDATRRILPRAAVASGMSLAVPMLPAPCWCCLNLWHCTSQMQIASSRFADTLSSCPASQSKL